MTRPLRLGLALMIAALSGAAASADDGTDCLAGHGPTTVDACRRAFERTPTVDLALAAAAALEKRRHYRAAVDLLEEAVKRFPEDPRLAAGLAVARSNVEEQAWVRGGEASAGAGQVAGIVAAVRCTRLTGADALAACDQALAGTPDDSRLQAARGDALMALSRADEAAQAYRAALRLTPDDAAVKRKLVLAGAPTTDNLGKPEKALVEQLATLRSLHDGGLISAQDYEQRRRGLLDGQFGGVERPPAPMADGSGVDFGGYHALVIGINDYQHITRLETAVRDAEGVAAVLRDLYGFKVTLLANATRAAIIDALDDLRDRLGPRDNLLIYYAGHGWLDKEAEQGFWLPVDARPDRRTNWISNDTVRDTARALQAKHVLIVADSCFSGTLTRGITVPPPRPEPGYLKRIADKKARLALSSGGLEPVADNDGVGHSPFAKAFMDVLRDNTAVLDGTSLFGQLRRPVVVNAEQTPEYSDIRRAGHDGGDFLFVRRK